MKMLSQSTIDEICTPFLEEIKQNGFQIHFTTNGSLVIILSRNGKGERPIIGVYWTGEEWLPATWLIDGSFINTDHPRGLDLRTDNNKESA